MFFIALLTESQDSLFYDSTCLFSCLEYSEILLDPLLAKLAVLVTAISGVFGCFYWNENVLRKIYKKCFNN